METIAIEPTNACNRHCLHCLRNTVDKTEFLPLQLLDDILSQAKSLGIKTVSLTGGEISLYPHLKELFLLIADYGFKFTLVSNAFEFEERILPHLLNPSVKGELSLVCFSLDGARAQTHDALRGRGSFKEVMKAVALCELKGLPLSFKTAVTNLNKEELTDLALLAASLGGQQHEFISLFPTPNLIKKELLPTPMEMEQIGSRLMSRVAKTLKSNISITFFHYSKAAPLMFSCNIQGAVNVDFQGNLMLCCNLSHVITEEGRPTCFGGEMLADLRKVPLKKGIRRHYQGLARLMEARLRDSDSLCGVTHNPCYWCFKHFGKLAWLKNYPESPWAAGVLDS